MNPDATELQIDSKLMCTESQVNAWVESFLPPEKVSDLTAEGPGNSSSKAEAKLAEG